MNRITRTLAGLAVTVGLVVGCGGGGGGGGSSGFSYDGNTSQAQLTQANSQDFVDETVTGAGGSDSLAVRASASEPVASSGGINLARLGRILKDSVTESSSGGAVSRAITSATQSGSDSVTGSCGGSASFTVTFDDVTGDFTGSMNYQAFCEDGVVVDGSASFSGVLDPGTGALEQFTLTVAILSVTEGGETAAFSGSVSIDVSSTTVASVTYDVAFRVNGETFRLANLTIQIDELTTPSSATINGRIYHPVHGYIDISTTTPVAALDDGNPQSGEVVFTGAAGSSATVTFTSVDTYTIVVNDGTTITTLNCTWSTETCTV